MTKPEHQSGLDFYVGLVGSDLVSQTLYRRRMSSAQLQMSFDALSDREAQRALTRLARRTA